MTEDIPGLVKSRLKKQEERTLEECFDDLAERAETLEEGYEGGVDNLVEIAALAISMAEKLLKKKKTLLGLIEEKFADVGINHRSVVKVGESWFFVFVDGVGVSPGKHWRSRLVVSRIHSHMVPRIDPSAVEVKGEVVWYWRDYS